MSPVRIQRRRTKGWRMPEGAVYVGRGSKWGNPYRLGEAQMRFPRVDGQPGWEYEGRSGKTSGQEHAFFHSDGRVTWHDVRDATAEEVIELYRAWLPGELARGHMALRGGKVVWLPLELAELRGKDLVCWCPLDRPCHADVLLELANRGS